MWWLLIPVAIYSIGIFALWLLLARSRDHDTHKVRTGPTVSVVVACRNEEKTITTLLERLADQDYPADLFEIIVVNDHSTDRTPVAVSEFINGYAQRSALKMRLIFNPSSGKKSAIRHGIKHSSGELILTTDADCIMGREWVRSIAELGPAADADMVLGDVHQFLGSGFWSHFGRLEFSALQSVTEATVLSGHPVMCNAANMGIRRDVYLRHCGELRDDVPSGDDIFLLHGVKRAGGRIVYCGGTAAAVGTAAAGPAAALLRQRARWASKAFFYRDTDTLILAAATAACNAAVTAAAITSIISTQYLPLLATLYALRLLPDYLIINHHRKKRERRTPLLLFLLSELIYPFYLITVALISLFPCARRFKNRD